MDYSVIDDIRVDDLDDTSEPQPSLDELNRQWAISVSQLQKTQDRKQRKLDDNARHSAIIDITAYLVSIKHLIALLLLFMLLNSLCTLLILWQKW